MESLKDLMAHKDLDEPTEITALKRFCHEEYHCIVKISVQKEILWLSVPNGIIATELRMRQNEIIERCGITKKLRIKIG